MEGMPAAAQLKMHLSYRKVLEMADHFSDKDKSFISKTNFIITSHNHLWQGKQWETMPVFYQENHVDRQYKVMDVAVLYEESLTLPKKSGGSFEVLMVLMMWQIKAFITSSSCLLLLGRKRQLEAVKTATKTQGGIEEVRKLSTMKIKCIYFNLTSQTSAH